MLGFKMTREKAIKKRRRTLEGAGGAAALMFIVAFFSRESLSTGEFIGAIALGIACLAYLVFVFVRTDKYI